MPEQDSSTLQLCSACGAEIDVAEFEPLATVECPVCGSPLIVSKTLGQYELVEVMGRGGMGVVYRAIDHQLDRQVALKVLRNDFFGDRESITKLEEEAAITGGIHHPHVVKVYTTGTTGGRFFIAMELVDQGTLDDLLEVQGRVAEVQALEIASQIAQGLRAANVLGLIHRDVKPGNILFADAHQAKIVDFGLAMLEAASKGDDEVWGTPYYVSPERLDRRPEDFRSDMYSLGATIFHAIAGRPPFEAEDASRVALKHLKSQAVSLQAFAPWVAGSTAFVINRMLLKDPADRYESYDELIEHLEYARTELATTDGKAAPKKRVVLETDEDRKLWGQVTFAVLGVVVLLALGTGAYFLFFAPKEQPQQGSVVTSSIGAGVKSGAEFEAARKLLMANKPVDAAAAFHQLAIEKSTPQPLAQWALLQEALSHLLEGNLPRAQETMNAILQLKYEPATPAIRIQTDFLAKIAAAINDPKPTPSPDPTEYNRNTFSAIALLLIGLKDWELGDFENANLALRSFQGSAPAGEFVWIAEYQPLVEDYLADLSTYRGTTMLAKSAKTQTELLGAAKTMLKARGDLRKPGSALGTKLEADAKELLAKAKTAPPDATSILAKEKETLTELRNKTVDLCKGWNFKEALAQLAASTLTNADLAREQRILIRKLEWLTQFKAQLIRDLAKGYAEPIKLADGTPRAGPIAKATEGGIDFGAAGATESKKWSELAPESVCAIAESFITPDLPPNVASERRWCLGVYALYGGQRPNARKYLMESAKGNPQFSDLIGLLMPARRTDLARIKGVSATASDSVDKEGPENAIDGKPTTRWGSTAPGEKWLRLDLGKEYHLIRWVLRLAHTNNEPPELNLADFTLQRSTDDQTWIDVDAVQGNSADVSDRRVARVNSRYVRLLVKKPNRKPGDDPTAHLYSFEVYGWEGAGDIVTDFFATPPIGAPPELNSHDIGLAAGDSSGSTTIDDRTGIFTIHAGGLGLGTADAFRFLHRPLHGTGQIIVRIDGVDPVNPLAQAGVMVRESLAPDAACAYLGLANSNQLTWNVRSGSAAPLTEKREIGIAFPCWLRLDCKGKEVSGAWSRDGRTWKTIGSETVQFSGTAEIGLAAMSHHPKAFTNARLEVINFLR